jgi:hypothetical protein
VVLTAMILAQDRDQWRALVNTVMNDVRFEVFTAVTMKNALFCGVVPCRSCVNRRFGGMYRHHLQGRKIQHKQVAR